MRVSLRIQLSLWFGLAMLVIVLVTTFVAQQVTVWNLERSVDNALQKRANMVAAIISSDITTDEESYVRVMAELTNQEFPFVPLLLRIVSPTGTTITEFGRVSDQIVRSLDLHLDSPGTAQGRFDSISLEGIEPLRVYTISVSHPRTYQSLATVQAAEALGQVNEARDRLWRNGVSAGFTGGLLAMATGLVILRRGFRPLRTIMRTIDEVDYNHLKARLREETRPAELEQLAKSLTAMWQRLDVAVSARYKTIGNLSHDLRTPLTALQGQIEVLLLRPSLGPEIKDSLERMLRETRRLIRMVKDLLLNVQLQAGPVLALEVVNLKDLVDEVVGDTWALARGLELSVVAPSDLEVNGDRDLLKQMLLNVVDNAIKFTASGGQVELRLAREGEWAALTVSDTGRGIASEQLPHVTEAFYRSDAPQRANGEGARLGLAIVKQIAELHCGRLDISSRPGVGTSVTVRLPVGTNGLPLAGTP